MREHCYMRMSTIMDPTMLLVALLTCICATGWAHPFAAHEHVTNEVNLAFGKVAYQASTASKSGISGMPYKAVDGHKYTHIARKSCSNTVDDYQQPGDKWWAVDLAGRYQIDSVLIVNRADCCSTRLRDFIIGTTDISPVYLSPQEANIRKCVTQRDALGAGEERSFQCGETGRYVVIIHKLYLQPLTLCEVEVYGKPVPSLINLALKKTALKMTVQQSTDAWRAVDGNTHESCSYTHIFMWPRKHQWWAVDLGAEYKVFLVVIQSRGDCCWPLMSDYVIGTMHNNPPYYIEPKDLQVCTPQIGSLAQGRQKAFPCTKEVEGRYLVIMIMSTKELILCEVEVYGRPV